MHTPRSRLGDIAMHCIYVHLTTEKAPVFETKKEWDKMGVQEGIEEGGEGINKELFKPQ